MQPQTSKHLNKVPFKIILLTGLLVGALDITTACIDYYISTKQKPFTDVLKYIASGIFGKSAFSGGTKMMLAGVLFHYFFAFCFTFFFFWIYPKISLMRKNRVLTGIAYGIFIWLIMNLIVVQLSNVPHGPISSYKINKVIKAAIILIVMIGLPLSFIAYKYSYQRYTGKHTNNI